MTRHSRTLLGAIALGLTCEAGHISGQAPAGLRRGDFVRVQVGETLYEGELLPLRRDSLAIIVPRHGMPAGSFWRDTARVAQQAISAAWARRVVARKTGRGALIGTAAGGLVVGGILAASWNPCVPRGFLSCMLAPASRAEAFLLGAVLGGVPGLLFGALAGSAHASYAWDELPLPVTGER